MRTGRSIDLLVIGAQQSRGLETPSPHEYDPFAPTIIRDPYPWYDWLRRQDGVFYSARRDLFVLSRYRDVLAAVRAHRSLSSAEGVAYQRRSFPIMLMMDPPDHTRLRRLVARDFNSTTTQAWRPTVERLVNAMLDRLLPDQVVDFVGAVAGPLPVTVIAEVLGIPSADHEKFKLWSDEAMEGFRLAEVESEDIVARTTTALMELLAYFSAQLDRRRTAPRDDLLTRLLRPQEEERLTSRELIYLCLQLLVAGHETTTNLLGNMILAFLEAPSQWARLKARPELIPAAVEEVLRFDAPIQGFFRTVVEPFQVAGATIPKDKRVLVLFAAANRDPSQYPDPDRFLIDRNPTDHLAFGSGIHQCLGAPLARLEGALVLERLIRSAARLELAGEVVRAANPALRGVARLPIRLVPS
ncbi:MAG: cytochrome P450 [Candidatus Rokuibacteriota bacterium]